MKIKCFRLSLRGGIGITSRIRSNELSLYDSSLPISESKQKRSCTLSPKPAVEGLYALSKGINLFVFKIRFKLLIYLSEILFI